MRTGSGFVDDAAHRYDAAFVGKPVVLSFRQSQPALAADARAAQRDATRRAACATDAQARLLALSTK
jgi:hypothetical protein